MNGYEASAAILKALNHPVRLQILTVLRQEEACVCHLEAALGQRQAYISQQLMKLRDAGLVADRRDGMNVFYRLTGEAVEPLLDAAMAAAEAASGQTLDFSLPAGPSCPCPRCELIHPQVTEQGEMQHVNR